MAPTIVLITGANRGIGKGLLEKYLARPNHTVIGTVRDPDHESSKALASLPKAKGSSLVLVKFDITVKADGLDAVKQLEAQGIDHLDIVIANAGVCFAWPKVSEIKVEDIEGHYVPNVHGLIFTYQATLPLLKKSKNGKWITIGSSYGTSKVVAHWLTKAIHREEPELVAFPIDPG
ncbi:hypothetical protein COL26b_009053 [Colletotrichum chrysophilum]|uniref:uncharacterized protein n=1 Tax=Colletotrichum chrysophilum TaxID=1836956 RepID=UPI002301DCC0|nr:uncharacterized protein COL26b_009053 [Colletotrichum chrysophilum]KAJ0372709.1 hypothetical protein COL26b_009053 [Colletotrichum chrysophilum]